MRKAVMITMILMITGCSKPTATPDLSEHLLPINEKWAQVYDVNDLEVQQTYNLAITRVALKEIIERVEAIENALGEQ